MCVVVIVGDAYACNIENRVLNKFLRVFNHTPTKYSYFPRQCVCGEKC